MTHQKEQIVDKIQEYIKSLKADYFIYHTALPVLREWEGKQITKRLVTKMKTVFPEDFVIYLTMDFPYGKLIFRKGRREKIFDLCVVPGNKTFDLTYFFDHNKEYDYLDKIKKYEEGLRHIDEWIEKYETIVESVSGLKAEMKKYGCEYTIDWGELRFVQ
jgi:hypothetical protein